MRYLLDTNVFIQAKNLHYHFDFCPAFWDWLIEENELRKVFSIEKVKEEIREGEDELADWVSERDSTFFLKPDQEVSQGLEVVTQWVCDPRQKYRQSAINEFLTVADYYLVAHAWTHKFTVVTHERSDNSQKKIKIPNVCDGLQIEYISPFEMLRSERAKFVLDRS